MKRSDSIFNISLCNFGTLYGLEHMDFVSPFSLKSTEYFFQAPIVP